MSLTTIFAQAQDISAALGDADRMEAFAHALALVVGRMEDPALSTTRAKLEFGAAIPKLQQLSKRLAAQSSILRHRALMGYER